MLRGKLEGSRPRSRRLTERQRDAERLLISPLFADSSILCTHSLPTLPSLFPGFYILTSPPAIMQWLDRSRWTTAPFYALVIFIIACGTIPKGMWRVARGHRDHLRARRH